MGTPCHACQQSMRNEELCLRVNELLLAHSLAEQRAAAAEAQVKSLRGTVLSERSIGAELWMSALVGLRTQIEAVLDIPEIHPTVRDRLVEIIGKVGI